MVEVALAALFRRSAGRVELLVARRPDHAIRGGLWEFPGGKIEPGEEPAGAALRELEEEVGICRTAIDGQPTPLVVVEHSDPELIREKSVRLHAFLAEVKPSVEPLPPAGIALRWVEVKDLATLEWPRANARINDRLREIFGEISASAPCP